MGTGAAETRAGQRARIVAFGSSVPSDRGTAYRRVCLGHVLDVRREYVGDHWSVLRHAHLEDPAFAFLARDDKTDRSAARGLPALHEGSFIPPSGSLHAVPLILKA